MARTNKIWIFKKKQQLEKIKLLKSWWKRYLKNKWHSEEEKIEKWLIFDLENPNLHKFTRDKSGRKIICKQTGLREDFDWYRLVLKPNSTDIQFIFSGINSRLRKKIKKSK